METLARLIRAAFPREVKAVERHKAGGLRITPNKRLSVGKFLEATKRHGFEHLDYLETPSSRIKRTRNEALCINLDHYRPGLLKKPFIVVKYEGPAEQRIFSGAADRRADFTPGEIKKLKDLRDEGMPAIARQRIIDALAEMLE